MGYYTKYDISSNDDINHKPLIEAAFEIDLDEENKWYAYSEDMVEYSKKYPTTLFTLRGEGTSGGVDVWVAYYRNGKFQTCEGELVFPEFDDKLLT